MHGLTSCHTQLGPGCRVSRRRIRNPRSEPRADLFARSNFDDMNLKPELLRGIYAYG